MDPDEVVIKRLTTHFPQGREARFEPAGYCIYCGAEPPTKLTEEHVVGTGLNGQMILPAASCERCARATSKVERYIMKTMFGDVRAHLGIPTKRKRRKKAEPHKFLMRRRTHGDKYVFREVAKEDRPFVLQMMVFGPPRILRGLPPVPGAELASPGFWWINDATLKENGSALGLILKIGKFASISVRINFA